MTISTRKYQLSCYPAKIFFFYSLTSLMSSQLAVECVLPGYQLRGLEPGQQSTTGSQLLITAAEGVEKSCISVAHKHPCTEI